MDEKVDFIELPFASKDLIILLDEHYPHRCIAFGESESSAQRYAGMRELIDELKVWQEEQDEFDSDSSRH